MVSRKHCCFRCTTAPWSQSEPIVRDERAVELLGRIDYDFSSFGKFHVGFPVRAKRMDDIVRAFLTRYRDGAVVNLGGELDTQLYRVDNGRVHWFEIDLPESIGVRREFFEESARHRMIACSSLDFTWMEEIEGRSPVMFVTAGLLPYSPPDEVNRLVTTLATRFPGSEMVFDTVSEWFFKTQPRGEGQDRGIHSSADALGHFVANKFHACTVQVRFKLQGVGDAREVGSP
jgi:O-methyltransferase involved in polyketide biosynthesis